MMILARIEREGEWVRERDLKESKILPFFYFFLFFFGETETLIFFFALSPFPLQAFRLAPEEVPFDFDHQEE